MTDVPGAGQKRVIAIDLTGATNIVGDRPPTARPALEAANAAGVTPVAKTLWLELNRSATPRQAEGIGL